MMAADGWEEIAAAIDKWLDGVLDRPGSTAAASAGSQSGSAGAAED
jgi:hypothetical protein